MEFIKKIFGYKKKEENATYTLLRKALPRDFDFNNISKVYSIISYEYDEGLIEELKTVIRDNKLLSFSKVKEFNSSKDAVELFLIEKKNNIFSICIMFSPVEFYENEYILDIININYVIDISCFKNSTLIFSNSNKK